MPIRRIWHGWTTPQNAAAYEHLLKTEIFAGIEARGIPGYRGVELLRRDAGEEVELVTIMTFDSLQNLVDFQGDDYEVAYVPDSARKVLKRWDARAAHYEVREARISRGAAYSQAAEEWEADGETEIWESEVGDVLDSKVTG